MANLSEARCEGDVLSTVSAVAEQGRDAWWCDLPVEDDDDAARACQPTYESARSSVG